MIQYVLFALGLLIAQAASAGQKMTETFEDPSMLLFRATGVELASSDIALALAEMIIKKIYGSDELLTQVPLRIADGGDRWVIDGSRRAEDHPPLAGQVSIGAVHIEILKANCQVVKLSQKGYLPSRGTP
jgi:hypothetical protein